MVERKKIEAKDGCDRFRSLTTPGRGNLGWGEENLVGWLKFTYNFSSNFRNCSPNTGPLGLTSADVSVTRRGKSLAPPINFRMGSAPTGPRTHTQKKENGDQAVRRSTTATTTSSLAPPAGGFFVIGLFRALILFAPPHPTGICRRRRPWRRVLGPTQSSANKVPKPVKKKRKKKKENSSSRAGCWERV